MDKDELINRLLWACQALEHALAQGEGVRVPHFLDSVIKDAKKAGYSGTFEK